MKTSTRSTMLFALVLACGPSVGKPSGEGSGSGGSESTTAAASVSSTASTSADASSSSSDASSGSTGEPAPAECAAVGWDTSYDTFRELVAQAGGHYWYSSRRAAYGSSFGAACFYTTTIEVADGVVIRRIRSEAELVPNQEYDDCGEPPFDEMGAAVGSHEGSYAGPPWLLDELYDRCCDDILTIQPADDYDISFDTFDNGVIRGCSAFQHDCADGCDMGPDDFGATSIEQFELGALPP